MKGQRRLHVGLLPDGLLGVAGSSERAADLVDELYGGHGVNLPARISIAAHFEALLGLCVKH